MEQVGSITFMVKNNIYIYIKMSLCLPSGIYLVISLLSLVYYITISFTGKEPNKKNNTLQTVLIMLFKLIVMILWTLLLNLLCRNKHNGWAWFILLFPIIIFYFIIFGGVYIYSKNESKKK